MRHPLTTAVLSLAPLLHATLSSNLPDSPTPTAHHHKTDEISEKVYDDLVRYAYIAKSAYCIEKLKPLESDLSRPLVLEPEKHTFIQNGSFDLHTFPVELYVAKLLYSDAAEEDDKAEGFFAVDHSGNGSIVVAIRGSSTTRDLITDVGISMMDYTPVHLSMTDFEDYGINGCKVHKGFYKRVMEIKSEVFDSVEKLLEVFPDYQLVLTGHSMGGSLASLIGLEFALMGHHPLVVTYGSPKVGNKHLSELMDAAFYTEDVLGDIEETGLTEGLVRVLHKGDYAPLLPPSTSFVPTGLEFEIDLGELPHHKEDLCFNGLSLDKAHMVTFNVWDVLSFDLKRFLHLQEHREYFWSISTCADIH